MTDQPVGESVDLALDPSPTAISVLVVSEDPIFCCGIRAILLDRPPLTLTAEFESLRSLWEGLTQNPPMNLGAGSFILLWHLTPTLVFDPLVYEYLQQAYPQGRVLAIGRGEIVPVPPRPGLSLLWGAFQPDRLVEALTEISQEQGIWWVQPSLPLDPSGLEGKKPDQTTPQDWWSQWTIAVRRSGLGQVNQDLDLIETTLRTASLSWLDRQLLQGQQRELRFVRWLLHRGLPPTEPMSPENLTVLPSETPSPEPILDRFRFLDPAPDFPADATGKGLPPVVANQDLETLIFDRLTAKLAAPLVNLTPIPLEIDALSLPRRRELLLLVLQALSDRLVELRHSQVSPDQVQRQQLEILQDLWQDALTRFFGQYSTVLIPTSQTIATSSAIPILPPLLQGLALARSSLLQTIPQVDSILQTLLFQSPLTIDGVPYRCESPEAIDRLCQLLENLSIQVANSIVQPLLNQFSQVELIKQTFFNPGLLSTRQIERFRNNLSWKYRFSHSFEEPKSIYESYYYLWILDPQGIRRISIYAPRQGEINDLTPWQQTLTFSLECRDAIAPRLQTLTTWLGRGLGYLLTQIIGRSLGLIGRGILQGLGTAWSERDRLGKGN